MRNLSRVAIFFILLSPAMAEGITNSSNVVVMNEIAWMGTKVDEIDPKNWWRYEWLELYNNTNQLISLDGWKIELYRTSLDWSLELKGSIPTQSYFLIVASDKIFPNYDLNYSNLGGKLNNNGQKVVLKNAAGTIIDDIDCTPGWFAGDNNTKQTMERKIDGNWQTSQNPGGTPKEKNSIAIALDVEVKLLQEEMAPESPVKADELKPIIYPSGIVINEILPSPEGPDEKEEWIEIFNQNDFEVDLSGWQINDTIGKINTYTFSIGTKISPQGFLVLSRPTTKITLNNEADGLNLIQPDGKIIDAVNYEKAPRGQSYNRMESGWVWSSVLTPGSVNITSLPAVQKEIAQDESGKELQKNQSQKQQLAAIGEQLPRTFDSLYIFLIALGLAIFSGAIILILKKKLKDFDFSKKLD